MLKRVVTMIRNHKRNPNSNSKIISPVQLPTKKGIITEEQLVAKYTKRDSEMEGRGGR